MGQSYSLGVYNKEGTHNDKPYYINDNNNRYLFYGENGEWQIGTRLGGGVRIQTAENGLDNLPIGAGGWE